MTTIDTKVLQAQIAKLKGEAANISKTVDAVLRKAIETTDEKRKLQLVAEAHDKLRDAKKAAKTAEAQASAIEAVLEAVNAAS